MFKCIRSASTKVRRPLNSDRYDPRYTVKTVKHPAQVMVWGCFTGANGRGGLYFLPKGEMMNGATYKTVLEDHLLPFMTNFRATHCIQAAPPVTRQKWSLLCSKIVLLRSLTGQETVLTSIQLKTAGIWWRTSSKRRIQSACPCSLKRSKSCGALIC